MSNKGILGPQQVNQGVDGATSDSCESPSDDGSVVWIGEQRCDKRGYCLRVGYVAECFGDGWEKLLCFEKCSQRANCAHISDAPEGLRNGSPRGKVGFAKEWDQMIHRARVANAPQRERGLSPNALLRLFKEYQKRLDGTRVTNPAKSFDSG